MTNERIYQSNPYQITTKATVVNTIEKSGFDVIILNQTTFFPTGGGQLGDTGTITSDRGEFRVTDTFDENLEAPVCHMTDAPHGTFAIGDEVTVTIDWEKRFSNMQRHTGEHILSGVFYMLHGGMNKGFHMSSDYIAIDIDLEGRTLSADEIAEVELAVNRIIWRDLPVTTTWFDSYEESLALPVRKKVPHDGRVSVVTIGSDDDIVDCIGCCGTHVSSTGQVGIVRIAKTEPCKGWTRVYFDCGQNAYNDIKKDQAVLYEVAGSFSCGRDDLKNKLQAEKDRTNQLKARLAKLSEFAAEAEYREIAGMITGDGAKLVSKELDSLEVNDIVKLGFRLSELMDESQLLALSDRESHTVLLFSKGTVKCGDIVKSNAPDFNGRGGGRPDNARASFASGRDAASFISRLGEIML